MVRMCFFIFSAFIGGFSTSASSQTLLFSDNFESGYGNWANVAGDDNKQWSRDSAGTPSGGTGPSTGAGSSYYIYLETSSGAAYTNRDTAILLGPPVSGSGIQLTFQYHMYGNDMGSLNVDVLDGGVWLNSVWSISGEQHTSNSASYAAADVDLSMYSVSQIRLRAVAAGGFLGDMAIDNVEIWSAPVGPVAPVFISDPISKAGAVMDQPYLETLAADASDGNGDTLTFSKLSGPGWLSVASDGTLSGEPNASDVGLNEFFVQVSDGGLSSSATISIDVADNTTPVLLFSDDFEQGYGNWVNTPSGDNRDWTRDSAGTTSGGTGPSTGADNSTYYVYLETSSGFAYTAGDTAHLVGPLLSGADVSLSFRYHMYGADTGTLAVDVLSSGTWINDVWTISGQQHTSNVDTYSQAEVDLSGFAATQIRFRATAAGNYRGDMAIDNIEIWSIPLAGPVAPVFTQDPLIKAEATANQSYGASIAADASDANGDVLSFSKLSGPSWLSISSDGNLSGIPALGDVGLNIFTVEVSDGALSSTATLEINVDDGVGPNTLFSDNFESGLGNWSNAVSGDSHDWILHSGGTSSSNTGPLSGEGGSGSYLYMETSSGFAYTAGNSVILNSPAISGQQIHLAMYYHMYGSEIGMLAVDVYSSGAWVNDVWSLSGQQHSGSASAWSAVDIDLSAYDVSQIRIRAVAVGGFMGDIGIDSLEISSHFDPNDLDGDGVRDTVDQCPGTPANETADTNGCSPSQIDSDNDGVVDSLDAFPFDPTETVDTDGDLIGNNADTDDDGDGVSDTDDAFPLDANESLDTDGDLIGNNTDSDDDGDGVLDVYDAFPLDANESVDTDGDLIGNNTDTDDDADGVLDTDDAFPLDAGESLDTDGDLIGNNSDTDDDNDGLLDVNDGFPLISITGYVDTDSDGIPNDCDSACAVLGMFADGDDDNDGVEDILDAFPLDATETIDSDGDGVGDNSDAFPDDSNETADSDGDGVGDNADAFPADPGETLDTDTDGIGNNADTDDDGDGTDDSVDAFPLDPTETLDTDADGVGNNADSDDDNDGVDDTLDVFPLDASETLDSDNDGVGDNADAFPADPAETLDTDGDGIGNNADSDDDNDGVEDSLDAFPFDPDRTHAYSVGGSITGLDSAITLSLNSTESLSIDVDGGFQFTTVMQDGDQYSVSISTMPTDQICLIGNPIGTIDAANVTGIAVTCFRDSYTLTPTVDGNIIDEPVDGVFDSISDAGLTISPKSFGSFGGSSPYNQRAVMEFDLSQLPPGIIVESASLRMTAFSGTSGNTFLMHGYEGDGVISLSDADATETLADIQIRSSKPSSVTFDLTEYTNSLLSRGVNYLGLSLRGEELSNNTYLDFGASEYAQGAPTLTISLRGERSQAHHWRRIEVMADGFATDDPIDGVFDTLNTYAGSFDTQYSWVNYITRYIIKRSVLEFDTTSLGSLGGAITYSRLHLFATRRGGGLATEIDLYGYNGDGTVTINDVDTAASYIDTVSLDSTGSFFYDITDHVQQLQLEAVPYAGFQIRASSEGNSSSTDDIVGITSSEGASAVFFAPYVEMIYVP